MLDKISLKSLTAIPWEKKIKYLQYFPFEDPSGVRQIQTPLEGEDVLSGMGLVIEHYWQKN